MVYTFLCIAIVIFVVGIKILGIVPRVRHIMAESHAAVSVIKAPGLSEEEKEVAIQRAAIRMIRSFGSILIRSAFVCLTTAGFVLLFSWLGFYSIAQVYETSTDVYFLSATTIVMMMAFICMR